MPSPRARPLADRVHCGFCDQNRPADWFGDGVNSSRRCKECRKVESSEKYRRARSRNASALSAYRQKHRARLKVEAMDVYGGACACCGESDLRFLTLDHVGGGGNTHRRLINGNGRNGGGVYLYQYLRNQGWPTDPPLQVLCWNCNLGCQLNDGVCPHKEIMSLVLNKEAVD